MSLFETCFLMLDNPRGGVEDISYIAAKAPWLKGVFCNVRDYAPADWQTVRQRCNAFNLFCGPWGRTTTPPGSDSKEFDPNILELIIKTADAWGSEPLIVNSESELKGSGADLTHYIAAEVGIRQAAISMEPWPFANVDWVPVGHLPVLPQIFGTWNTKTVEAKAEWHRVGVKCVYHTFGAFDGATSASYPLKAPYSIFPGDGIMATYSLEAWAPTSTAYKGCVEVAPPPPGPTTAETRRLIADAAADWEDGQSAPTPLTRITVARRVVETTNTQWAAVSRQIVKLLDDAGVGA